MMIFSSAFLINLQFFCTPFRLLPGKQDKLAGLDDDDDSLWKDVRDDDQDEYMNDECSAGKQS